MRRNGICSRQNLLSITWSKADTATIGHIVAGTLIPGPAYRDRGPAPASQPLKRTSKLLHIHDSICAMLGQACPRPGHG